MLRRIIYEDWQLIFPVVAFLVAAAIYASVTWRALRMKQVQVDRLSQLPFDHD